MKVCNTCKEEKSLESYGINITTRDGYQNKCRICVQAYRDDRKNIRNAQERVNYIKNKEHILNRQKAWEEERSHVEYSADLTKVCSECRQEKPLDHYHKSKLGKYGRVAICAVCKAVIDAQYNEDNREAISIQRRAYRQNNKEKIAEKDRIYRQNNLEKIREADRQYYQKTSEERLAYQRKYRLENPEKIKEQNIKKYQNDIEGYKNRARKRQALEAEATVGYMPDNIKEIHLYMQRDCCALCWEPIEEEYPHPDIHLEHIIPLSRGGDHSLENTQVTHGTCNQRKWARNMEEYEEYLEKIGESY